MIPATRSRPISGRTARNPCAASVLPYKEVRHQKKESHMSTDLIAPPFGVRHLATPSKKSLDVPVSYSSKLQ